MTKKGSTVCSKTALKYHKTCNKGEYENNPGSMYVLIITDTVKIANTIIGIRKLGTPNDIKPIHTLILKIKLCIPICRLSFAMVPSKVANPTKNAIKQAIPTPIIMTEYTAIIIFNTFL